MDGRVRYADGGSPPRAWRRSYQNIEGKPHKRFTSTRVETLTTIVPIVVHLSVHLHARGDAAKQSAYYAASNGSPPRAWRRSLAARFIKTDIRFTSTRVETLQARRQPSFRLTVHLHARGDAIHSFSCSGYSYGSPPRAWRRCSVSNHSCKLCRFTSTRVETLIEAESARLLSAVHLHARGDASGLPFAYWLLAGSPPRAWRRCKQIAELRPYLRFTSTRVETLLGSSSVL